MENKNLIDRLNKYQVGNENIYTGFKSFEEAEQFAKDKKGVLVEVGFLDGNDNPNLGVSTGLIEERRHYKAYAGPEYKILHSSDQGFKEASEILKRREQEIQSKSLEEEYISDSDDLLLEDAVIVLYKGDIESVTSRERSKYLKNTKVYEIGVKVQHTN